ncbi:MAG: peptide ABC transporter substrate-binding protein [Patescibacteria group bacterium]
MFYLFNKIFYHLSKIELRLIIGALLIFLVSAFFITVNIYYQNTIEQPKRGGKYIEGIVGQPSFINPLIANQSETDKDLIEIIFCNLNDLVAGYQISEDNKSWTLTLKENLKWSDNEPIAADDVLFTIETVQNPSNNHPQYPTWQGIVIERLNQNEIRLTLKTPYVFLIDNFKELKIAPRHIFNAIPAANLRLSRYNLEPVGSGPYKFKAVNIRKDGFITDYQFIPNEYYFGNPPYIEELTFQFYENESDAIEAFNKKKIDGLGGLNKKQLNDIGIGYQTLTINLPRYYAVFFNSNANSDLKSQKIRAALDLATDKEKITKTTFDDQTIIMNGPLPPNISGYSQSVYKDKKFNLEEAEKILESAGLTEKEDGVRIELNIIIPQISFLEETAKIIRSDWEKIGVKLNTITLDPDDISNNVIRSRNYEMILFGNILKKNPDLFSFWHSSERFYPGRNLSLYENKNVDSLLENIRQDFNNYSRNQKLEQLQKIINEDKPAIFLFSPNYLYLTTKNLKGFDSYFIATPAQRFENINQWHLKTTRVTPGK